MSNTVLRSFHRQHHASQLQRISSKDVHTMFTLAKYAYMKLDPAQAEWYNTVLPNPVRIELSICCRILLKMVLGRYELDIVGYAAAVAGHLDCLQAARRLGFQIDESTLARTLRRGSVECVDYILRDGFLGGAKQIAGGTYTHAVANGHLDCARTLLRHGVPWDGNELVAAVTERRADCVRFLLENGCPLSHPTTAMMMAVAQSDVACVALLRQYGMPWSGAMPMFAISFRNYDVLQYIIENGCPNPSKVGVRRSARLMERTRLNRLQPALSVD